MTILSTNIQRLKDENGFTIKYLADQCEVSAAAASQWIQKKNPYVPSLKSLIVLAGLFKTTIEDLATNPCVKSGDVVSPMLNFLVIEKVFTALAEHKGLSYTFARARYQKKAYMFGLLYSLFEDVGDDDLDMDNIYGLLDSELSDNNKKNQAIKSTRRKHARKSTKKRQPQKGG